MNANMGSADRVLRIIVSIIIAALYFSGQITGTTGIILLILAVIFVLTSLVGFCPLYKPFNFSTKKTKN
ncbi:MAG: DUF2892 domain-containing protein [Chitinophagaceae bacterium]|jgi:hypothetical protein